MTSRVLQGQADGLRQLVSNVRGRQVQNGARIIAVTSGKGGVGKTNLAVNLGLSLVERGKRVAVLDADMGLANVDIVIGKVPKFNLSHVLAGEKTLEEIIMDGPGGLKVLAGGSGAEELANLSQWKLNRFLGSLQTLDEMFDVVLIDTGAGISRNVLGFVLSAQEVVVVTTPDPTAITDAYSLVKVIASKQPQNRVGLLVNMVDSLKQAQNVYNKLRLVAQRFLDIELQFFGAIPDEAVVREAVRRQRPFLMAYPNSQASKAVRDVAARICGVEPEGPRGISQLFDRMISLFR